MIAMYLGIGITVFLIVVGICVECMKKRYYEDKADLDSSIDSGSIEQTMESNLKQSGARPKNQRQGKKYGGGRDRQDDSSGIDPMDKRERGGGRSYGSVKKEGGSRDYDDDPLGDDQVKAREGCFCYEHITRNTADCLCNYCLSRPDNDLEELEKQVYKR